VGRDAEAAAEAEGRNFARYSGEKKSKRRVAKEGKKIIEKSEGLKGVLIRDFLRPSGFLVVLM